MNQRRKCVHLGFAHTHRPFLGKQGRKSLRPGRSDGDLAQPITFPQSKTKDEEPATEAAEAMTEGRSVRRYESKVSGDRMPGSTDWDVRHNQRGRCEACAIGQFCHGCAGAKMELIEARRSADTPRSVGPESDRIHPPIQRGWIFVHARPPFSALKEQE